jgi:Domain of unknown function (DUF1841)
MFDPSRDQVRAFFFETWRKYRAGMPLAGLENLGLDIMLLHPEYHGFLSEEKNRERDFTDESNPFLHMSLHLALEEQLSIDQPPGIAARFETIVQKKGGSRHDALHEALECLAETVWRAQRDGQPPDAAAYLTCLEKRSR